jgi:coniferyl-aldehyde dehydrogenase
VSAIVWGKLLSGGQTCIAPDYALVHESEVNTFIESYDRLVKAAYPDGPTSEDYTSIVNDQQYSMLIDLIDDARARGARIIEVGHRPGDATRRPHTLAPTVVLGVTDEMKIAHEEIFGPILPIFGYGNIDDAIDYVNARPRPLALYYRVAKRNHERVRRTRLSRVSRTCDFTAPCATTWDALSV